MNVPERIPFVPDVGTMVPNPPLYKPAFAPDVNFVAGVEKLPRLIPPVPRGIGHCMRLKTFWNSTRTFRLYLPSFPKRKARLKLAFSEGTRKLRNQRIEL